MTCRRCSHDADAHTHFRAGRDCGRCDCTRFKRRWGLARTAPAVVVASPAVAVTPSDQSIAS